MTEGRPHIAGGFFIQKPALFQAGVNSCLRKECEKKVLH